MAGATRPQSMHVGVYVTMRQQAGNIVAGPLGQTAHSHQKRVGGGGKWKVEDEESHTTKHRRKNNTYGLDIG